MACFLLQNHLKKKKLKGHIIYMWFYSILLQCFLKPASSCAVFSYVMP